MYKKKNNERPIYFLLFFFCFSTCWTKILSATTRLGYHLHDSLTENSVLYVDILLRQQNILHSFNDFFFYWFFKTISQMLNILLCLMLCLFSNKSICHALKKRKHIQYANAWYSICLHGLVCYRTGDIQK